MNKNKTNISVVNAAGIRVNSNIIVGEAGSYSSGDILDANATEKMVTSKVNAVVGNANELLDTLEEIGTLIPTQATEQNKLADKQFVNSSVSTNTADFKGTYDLVDDLNNDLTSLSSAILASDYSTPNNNDYCFVSSVDQDGNTVYSRYKYTVVDNIGSWDFEYDLNNSSFTAAQWAAIQSGITASIVNNLHDSDKLIRSTSVRTIVTLTQDQYDALLTKDANTEYNIIENV